jgi:cellulose synthase/poly-beta-1,6-N-acetylglucosamine synthase-like glycosyltransferase
MTPPCLSVVICTHNPRPDIFTRTLAALRAQSMPVGEWELLVVDNASLPSLNLDTDLAWHPSFRLLTEPEVGVTAARLRGIREARAEMILFVDDDNLLLPDYLTTARSIGRDWPMLGAWGCGIFRAEWEVTPPAEFSDYLKYLAVHEAERDRWSNQMFDYAATPVCAGMCVRASVARLYADHVRRDPRRKLLGRTGANLTGCEDFDLAFAAIDCGLGTAVFRALAMTHVIQGFRVSEAYLLKLIEGHFYSTVLLHCLRDPSSHAPRGGLLAHVREFRLLRSLGPFAKKIHAARRRGEAKGWALVGSLPPAPQP